MGCATGSTQEGLPGEAWLMAALVQLGTVWHTQECRSKYRQLELWYVVDHVLC